MSGIFSSLTFIQNLKFQHFDVLKLRGYCLCK